jgi:mono/diheme cytochrome c family protein
VLVKLDIRCARQVALVCAVLTLPTACAAEEEAAAPAVAQAAAPAPESAPAAAANDAAPYSVECGTDAETGERSCLVDKATYVGWRTFNSVCYVCHGQDAVGTTFAPSLLERLQVIDKARFMEVVANGFQGQVGVMPGWKDNPNVNKRFEELYAYVKARADGVMPAGRPERKPE